MTKTVYSSASPYFTTPQSRWYLGPIALRSLPPDVTDTVITLDAKYQHRPDLLSYDLYGTPSYWWVFMTRNMDVFRDPIWGFTAGIVISVPSKNRVSNILTK